MTQNSMRYQWTFEQVDAKLKETMVFNIYKNLSSAAQKYGVPDNLVKGANIAGFEKGAKEMYEQGIV